MKMPLIASLRRRLGGYRRDRKGVATIEFALILPLLVLLLIGGIELMTFNWAVGRVQDASSTVGDLVAQNRTIDETRIGAIFDAADAMIATNRVGDNATDGLDVTVTSAIACECSPGSNDFCFTVLWSHRFNGSSVTTGASQGATISTPPSTLAQAENETVIVTELNYTYRPNLRLVLQNTVVPLDSVSFFRPRLSDRVEHTGGQAYVTEPTCASLAANP